MHISPSERTRDCLTVPWLLSPLGSKLEAKTVESIQHGGGGFGTGSGEIALKNQKVVKPCGKPPGPGRVGLNAALLLLYRL